MCVLSVVNHPAFILVSIFSLDLPPNVLCMQMCKYVYAHMNCANAIIFKTGQT